MQQIFFTLILSLILISCQSSTQGQTTGVQDIDVTEFKELMGADNTVILDVRTPKETAQGKIEGAVEINFYDQDFLQQIQQLDKEKTYLVYCKSGGRSAKCATQMETAGFPKIYNLNGGYRAWAKAQK